MLLNIFTPFWALSFLRLGSLLILGILTPIQHVSAFNPLSNLVAAQSRWLQVDPSTTIKDPRNNFWFKLACTFLDAQTLHNVEPCSNKFLQGNYAPVQTEHRGESVEVVEGEIPSDIDGLYVRNGPNPLLEHASTRRPYCWIDGHGMIHSVRFQGGKATYSNSYIPTPRLKMERAMGQEFFVRAAEIFVGDKGMNSFLKAIVLEPLFCSLAGLKFHESHASNFNVALFSSKIFCLHDAESPLEVFLSNEGFVVGAGSHDSFGAANPSIAAHSTVDPESGNFMIHSFLHSGPMHVGEVSKETGQVLKQQEPAGTTRVPFMEMIMDRMQSGVPIVHETAFTEHWRLVFDFPVRLDPANLWNKGKPLYDWDDKYNMRIGLVPRSHSGRVRDANVQWFDTGAPLFFLHYMNAWEEEDGTVVFWAPCSKRFGMMSFFLEDQQEEHSPRNMMEFRLSPKSGSIDMTLIDSHFDCESPFVHPNKLGRSCDFGFAGTSHPDPAYKGNFCGITIWDLKQKCLHKKIELHADEVGSETIAIPKTTSRGDDQVYLGAYTHNVRSGQSFFVLYDGTIGSFVARLKLPARVPFGLHGLFIDGKALEQHVATHGHLD